jgi:hypothetical protein
MDPGGWILFLMLGKEGGKCDANIHPSPYRESTRSTPSPPFLNVHKFLIVDDGLSERFPPRVL